MSYSCSDFTEDVVNRMVDLGLIMAEDLPDDDPERQASIVLAAIDKLAENAKAPTGAE